MGGKRDAIRSKHQRSEIQDIIRNNIRDLRYMRAEELLFEQHGERTVLQHIRAGGTDPGIWEQAESVFRSIKANHEARFGIGSFKVDRSGHFPVPSSVQAQCAREAGISEDAWKAIESDQRDVSVSELVAIAAMFHVDPGYLLAPPGDFLHENTDVRCGDFDGAKEATSEQWLLWIRGVAPLPSQDPDRYFRNMATATVFVDVPSDAKQQPRTGSATSIDHWAEVVRRRSGRTHASVSGTPVGRSHPAQPGEVTASGELLSAFVVLRELLRVPRGGSGANAGFESLWKRLQGHLIRLWRTQHLAPRQRD